MREFYFSIDLAWRRIRRGRDENRSRFESGQTFRQDWPSIYSTVSPSSFRFEMI